MCSETRYLNNTNGKGEIPRKGCMGDSAGWSFRLKELQVKDLITKAVISQGPMLGK